MRACRTLCASLRLLATAALTAAAALAGCHGDRTYGLDAHPNMASSLDLGVLAQSALAPTSRWPSTRSRSRSNRAVAKSLFRLHLGHIGIFKLADAKLEAGREAISFVRAEMYVETMSLEPLVGF